MISSIEESVEFGSISFTQELLNVIFKLSLVNLDKKKSSYALDKIFEEIFLKNKTSNFQDFHDFILHLNNELISIEEYLNDNSIKRDFKRKDIFLDTLFDCVNNCLLCFEKNINYITLLNFLSDSFLSLIRKGNIINNSKTNDIIRDFMKYINSSLEFYNNNKKNISPKFEEKKATDIETDDFKKQLQNLESQLNDYKKKYKVKDKECQEEGKQKEEVIKKLEDERKKNEELNQALTKNIIQRNMDKSNYEDIINSFQNQLSEIKNKFDDMDKKYEKIQKENGELKMELDITKKKVQKLQDIVNTQRNDINFLADFASGFSHQLDDVLTNLNDTLPSLAADNILLDAISILFY